MRAGLDHLVQHDQQLAMQAVIATWYFFPRAISPS
jgi:hypothetical protein